MSVWAPKYTRARWSMMVLPSRCWRINVADAMSKKVTMMRRKERSGLKE
jgi:hypothetical protein